MVNALVSANHALRNLGVVFLCTVIILRCCVKFSKPLSSSHKNRLGSFNRKQRRWNWRKEIWLKSMKSMWLILKKRCKLFSYIFSFFFTAFLHQFFILLPAKKIILYGEMIWLFQQLSCNVEVGCLRASKSYHYWQPAPRWRPFPWLA